jgi:hypothetical protein
MGSYSQMSVPVAHSGWHAWVLAAEDVRHLAHGVPGGARAVDGLGELGVAGGHDAVAEVHVEDLLAFHALRVAGLPLGLLGAAQAHAAKQQRVAVDAFGVAGLAADVAAAFDAGRPDGAGALARGGKVEGEFDDVVGLGIEADDLVQLSVLVDAAEHVGVAALPDGARVRAGPRKRRRRVAREGGAGGQRRTRALADGRDGRDGVVS